MRVYHTNQNHNNSHEIICKWQKDMDKMKLIPIDFMISSKSQY